MYAISKYTNFCQSGGERSAFTLLHKPPQTSGGPSRSDTPHAPGKKRQREKRGGESHCLPDACKATRKREIERESTLLRHSPCQALVPINTIGWAFKPGGLRAQERERESQSKAKQREKPLCPTVNKQEWEAKGLRKANGLR